MFFKHQQDIINRKPAKTGLWWATGTGKSKTALFLAYNWKLPQCLIICPKSLKENWRREIIKANLPIDYFVIMTKEDFKKNWDNLPRFPGLIVDEAHYFFNETSAMSKSLFCDNKKEKTIGYIRKHNPSYMYFLTATPHNGKSHLQAFTTAKMLGMNYNRKIFMECFYYLETQGTRRFWKPRLDKKTMDEIQEIIRNNGEVMALQDCFDVPETIFQVEFFELTSEQKAKIKEIKITEPVNIAKWTKIMQVCGGSLKGDEVYKIPDEYFACEKLNRLLDIVDEHKKIAVVCHFNAEIDMIAKKLSDAEKNVFIIRGEVKDRQGVVDRINEASECVVLIQASCSEGYGLPNIPIMVFYSYSFSLKDYIQMLGRIQRGDHLQKCVYISLVVQDCVDNDVYDTMMKKEVFQTSLYKTNELIDEETALQNKLEIARKNNNEIMILKIEQEIFEFHERKRGKNNE